MRNTIFLFLLLFTPLLGGVGGGSFGAFAQTTNLYAVGSAVPAGYQKLEKFPDGTLHFHGALQPGNLYIVNGTAIRASSMLYCPKYEDQNIVNNGTPYTTVRGDSTQAAWKVLFPADNYRFTLDPNAKTVRGELFEWWYEAWIMGGCTADGQNPEWLLEKGQAMYQSPDDPYVWTWTGLLKNYTGNTQSKRFKILGQYGWNPKHIHPFQQDAPILDATHFVYNSPNDYKWNLNKDGYYTIVINVFLETIHAIYHGTQAPDGVEATPDAQPRIFASGRQIRVVWDQLTTATVYTTDGRQVATESGTSITIPITQPGVYVVRTADTTRQVLVR